MAERSCALGGAVVSGQRILMTGSEGYIGRILSPMLMRAGHTVVGIDCSLFEPCGLPGHEAMLPATQQADIRDLGASDLTGFDTVIHLAALSNDPLGAVSPPTTFEINHEATVRLAELASKSSVRRFVFASTSSIYGAADDHELGEDAEKRPLTPYAESKFLAEKDVATLAHGGFSPIYLRAGTAYGLSPKLRNDLVVNNMVAHAILSGEVVLESQSNSMKV